MAPWTSISTADFPQMDPEFCRWMGGASGKAAPGRGRARRCSRASSNTRVAPGARWTAAQAVSWRAQNDGTSFLPINLGFLYVWG